MTDLTNELLKLREQNQDIARILDAFGAIDYIHQESLKAMGRPGRVVFSVKNSAEVTFCAPNASTAAFPVGRDKE